MPVRDAVGETDEGRERVACRGGCEVEGEGNLDFWTAPAIGDLREVSGDERREDEGVAFPGEAGGPVLTGLWWDDFLLLLLSLSAFGRLARGEMAGTGERGRAGLVVVVVVDGLRAAAAGSADDASHSPAGSVSDAEVVGMFGKAFSSAGDTGSGASAASSAVKGTSPSPPSVPPAASVAFLAGDDSSASRASIVASVGASCRSGNASRADWRFV